MSHKSCPSCGGAPSPDRACKVCGRTGPSTAITQAELDEINARVAELKALLGDVDLAKTPLSGFVMLSSRPRGNMPSLLSLLSTPVDAVADWRHGPRDGGVFVDEFAQLDEYTFEYLLDRARDKKEGKPE